MPKLPSFRTYVSYRLERVSLAARDAAEEIYRRECGMGLRPLRVLRALSEMPDCTVSEIVEATMFERSLVSRLIGDLVRDGMISRRICDDDARQIRLSTTARGEAEVAHAYKVGDELNDDLLSVLSPSERETFHRCLDKLMEWTPGAVVTQKGGEEKRA